jgi:hypothetical protein
VLCKAASAIAALLLATGCAGAPGPELGTPSDPTPASATTTEAEATFLQPPTSEVFTRALRTDMCALLDEAVLAELGWQRGIQPQTLTSCAGGSADQKQSVSLSVATALSNQPTAAIGTRCTRLKIVDPTTMIALKVQVRAEPDPCAPAERFLATAVRGFETGTGQTEPPNPWIALDACELLPPLLSVSARTLGGPKPMLREVRRLGPRGCIATHVEGEVTLSVSPAPGRAEDLDGDEVAVAHRPARVREHNVICVLRLVGQPLGKPPAESPGERSRQGFRQEVQVVTIEVEAPDDRCAVATAMAEALSPALPGS